MKTIYNFISTGFYTFVGVISLVMAYKSIFLNKLLPFHAKAAGNNLDSYDKPLQYVILALMKVSGLGFLIIGLLLIIFPILYNNSNDCFLRYAIPIISLIYCLGLFLINFYLSKQTKSKTPWQGSLIAMFIIILAIILANI
ncbi:MAG: hypothetical protein WCL51_10865 [Bacteroidota bacterium]